MAEFHEPRLGLLAGGVEAADSAAAAAGALEQLEHVRAEGASFTVHLSQSSCLFSA